MDKNDKFISFLESLRNDSTSDTIDAARKGFDAMGGFHSYDADALDDSDDLREYYMQKKEKPIAVADAVAIAEGEWEDIMHGSNKTIHQIPGQDKWLGVYATEDPEDSDKALIMKEFSDTGIFPRVRFVKGNRYVVERVDTERFNAMFDVGMNDLSEGKPVALMTNIYDSNGDYSEFLKLSIPNDIHTMVHFSHVFTRKHPDVVFYGRPTVEQVIDVYMNDEITHRLYNDMYPVISTLVKVTELPIDELDLWEGQFGYGINDGKLKVFDW